MDTNDSLHDRTDFGFQLLPIRNAAARAADKANVILAEASAGEEGILGAEDFLKAGWMLGSLMTSIKSLARRVDERFPELQPSAAGRLGEVDLDIQASAREILEAAEATLRNAVGVLDDINRHLVSEIDQELSVGDGPADEVIQTWLSRDAESQV